MDKESLCRYADWFVTAVRTGKAGAGGISMMLIPRQLRLSLIRLKVSAQVGCSADEDYEEQILQRLSFKSLWGSTQHLSVRRPVI